MPRRPRWAGSGSRRGAMWATGTPCSRRPTGPRPRTRGSTVPAFLADLDRAAGGVVARVVTSGDFKGKRDETTLLYPSGAKPERVLLVGLGKAGEISRNTIRRAAAVAAKRARALGAKQLAFAVAPEARNGVPAGDLGQVAGEGAAQ